MRLIREKEINHRYLQYSLDTIRVVDEARRQNGIVFETVMFLQGSRNNRRAFNAGLYPYVGKYSA